MPRNRKLHVQVPFDSNHAHNFKTAKSRVKFEPSLLRSLYKLSLWDYPRRLMPTRNFYFDYLKRALPGANLNFNDRARIRKIGVTQERPT